MSGWIDALQLMAAGFGLGIAAVTGAQWRRAELRAQLAEDLLARAAARRSDATAQGNRTRAQTNAERERAKVLATAEQMRAELRAKGPRQQALPIGGE